MSLGGRLGTVLSALAVITLGSGLGWGSIVHSSPAASAEVWRTEAEAGAIIEPMAAGTDAGASACGYVAASGQTGAVVFTLDVPMAGQYYLWARAKGTDWTSNSFWVSWDGAEPIHYEVPQFAGQWAWGWDAVRPVDQAATPFALAVGEHTLRFAPREAGTRLDVLVLTTAASNAPVSITPCGQTPTATVTPTRPTSPEVWRMEAESGGITSATGQGWDDEASACGCIHSPVTVSYVLDVPATGLYYLWARALAHSWTTNSFWVWFDDGPMLQFEIPPEGEWGWHIVEDVGLGGSPFSLTQGEHTLHVSGREDYARTDVLVLTDDPTYVPTHIDPCVKPSAGTAFGRDETVIPEVELASRQTAPDVAMDASGNAYAIWEDLRNGNSDVYFAYCPAGGAWGTSVRVNDDDGLAEQRQPALAVDDTGIVYAVWADWRDGGPAVYFALRPALGVWSANVRVSATCVGTDIIWPRPDIGVDASGCAQATWAVGREGNPPTSNVMSARRSAAGQWSPVTRVNDVLDCAFEPVIAVDGSGNATTLWLQSGNSDTIRSSFCPAGGDWEPSNLVSDSPVDESPQNPALAVDGDGNAYAMWGELRGSRLTYKPFGHAWSPSVAVLGGFPSDLAVDTSGTAYVVWADIGSDSAIYAVTCPRGGPCTPGVRVNDSTQTGFVSRLSIGVTNGGRAHVVWEDGRNGKGDIFGSSCVVAGAWLPNVEVSDDPGAITQGAADIAVDGMGRSYVIWENYHDDRVDIRFAVREADGIWLADECVSDVSGVGSLDYYYSRPRIAVDWAGNAYALWLDYRDSEFWNWRGTPNVYFAYRPAGGTWGANVRVNDLAGTVNEFWSLDIAADGSGNARAVWQDARQPAGIYSAYRPHGGSWGSSQLISGSEGSPHSPRIQVDSEGNAVAIWLSGGGPEGAVMYAHRPQGGTWGSATIVSDDTAEVSYDHSPGVALDAQGNLYAIWGDYRNREGLDIAYAFRPADGDWRTEGRVNCDPWSLAGTTEFDLSTNSAGYAATVWSTIGGVDNGIFCAVKAGSLNWSTLVRVGDTVGMSGEDPSVAIDSDGNAYIVWTDFRRGESHVYFAQSYSVPAATATPTPTPTASTTLTPTRTVTRTPTRTFTPGPTPTPGSLKVVLPLVLKQ